MVIMPPTVKCYSQGEVRTVFGSVTGCKKLWGPIFLWNSNCSSQNIKNKIKGKNRLTLKSSSLLGSTWWLFIWWFLGVRHKHLYVCVAAKKTLSVTPHNLLQYFLFVFEAWSLRDTETHQWALGTAIHCLPSTVILSVCRYACCSPVILALLPPFIYMPSLKKGRQISNYSPHPRFI